MTAFTPDEGRTALALVEHVATTRGVGVDWLDDDDRAAIAAAMDSDAPGPDRLRGLLDVIEAKITPGIVSAFIRERGLL